MNNQTLKPCPFCGDEPSYYQSASDGGFTVHHKIVCPNIDCEAKQLVTNSVWDNTEVVCKWNRRVGEE